MSDTVAIHHPRDPSRPTVIPARRYDPARHQIWRSARPEPEALPQDLPGRAALIAAGVSTMEGLRAIPDLDEIPGIGQATERRIHAYLERA